MTKNEFLIIGLVGGVFSFGLLVWPGMWEYRDSNGKSYKVNRITGSVKVLDPVQGYIDLRLVPRSSYEEIERVITESCYERYPKFDAKYQQCVSKLFQDYEKTKAKNAEDIKAGKAVYADKTVYLRSPTPTP
ncbi:MAG: hypothetical protein L0220_22640 [Acidobacteria bacterium]|nr:hypothetical protein [Acidobacteriota bacterium]